MSQIKVNGKPLEVLAVHKVNKGQEWHMDAAIRRDGADNLVFKLDGDTYVASWAGKPVGTPNDVVEFNGKAGLVVESSNVLNHASELPTLRWYEAVGATALGAGAGAVFGFIPSVMLAYLLSMGGELAFGPYLLFGGLALSVVIGAVKFAREAIAETKQPLDTPRLELLDHFGSRV